MSRIRTTVIGLEHLRPNAWNPNVMNDEMYRKELASIRKFGYVDPILARDLTTHYEIIDGEHRWKALKQLGYTEGEVVVIEGLTDEEAKQLTIVLNETRGKPDQKRLGLLLEDLLRSVPKSDLLDLFPIDPVQFDRLTGLDGFDWGTLGKADSPAGGRWVERTYRLPAEAALVIDEAIEKAKDGDDIADWQALEFVAADYLSTSATPTPLRTAHASTAAR